MIAYLAYSKSNKIAVDEQANVTGIIASLKEHAQGNDFWEGQLALVTNEIKQEESFPIKMAELKDNLNKIVIETQESMQQFYEENPSLKSVRSDAQRQADELREKADDIEQAEMDAFLEEMRLERIEKLKFIKRSIEKRIGNELT